MIKQAWETNATNVSLQKNSICQDEGNLCMHWMSDFI